MVVDVLYLLNYKYINMNKIDNLFIIHIFVDGNLFVVSKRKKYWQEFEQV